ncbi:MAG: thiol:disulfide interchange protein DsbA/DsbL [Neisseriaceae bacterium]|nr:thiol:disulfide interchange protein DsbA/DsbL [Neisseriaceae bacterium]
MKIKHLITGLALSLSFVAANADDLALGKDYTVLQKTIPQLNKDKIEVLEFYAYTCIHCKNLEKELAPKVQNLPTDTYFRPVHIVWDESYTNLARISAAVTSSGTKKDANPAIFSAIFDKNVDLRNPTVFKTWVNTQGAWGKKMLEAYNSPTNVAEAQAMERMTLEYNIDSTPQVIVGGKYRIKSSGNYAQDMQTLDKLIAKVRQERKMPAPSAAKPVEQKPAAEKPKKAAFLGTGALLAAKANAK